MAGEPSDRIQAPGTAEGRWRDWPRLRGLDPMAVDMARSAVVVAAHPDDEVLGLGGTLALPARSGARLRLIMVTDGEASHPPAARSAPQIWPPSAGPRPKPGLPRSEPTTHR
jgi:hypothetical protein